MKCIYSNHSRSLATEKPEVSDETEALLAALVNSLLSKFTTVTTIVQDPGVRAYTKYQMHIYTTEEQCM